MSELTMKKLIEEAIEAPIDIEKTTQEMYNSCDLDKSGELDR